MDIKTLLFALAIANLVFGLELILFQRREQHSGRNPFWVLAKFLQCVGWLFLAGRGTLPDWLYIPIGNGAVLCGFAYECWALFRITGRPVGRVLHGTAAAAITLVCILFTPLPSTQRILIASAIPAVIFALAGWAMLGGTGEKSLLRRYLGWNLWLMTLIQCVRILWVLQAPGGTNLFSTNLVQTVNFVAYLYVVLTNGFGMLLLTREAADRELHRVLTEQKTILDTLPGGLCILRRRVIDRCNPAMEAMFGHAPGTLSGRSSRCLYESDAVYEEDGQRVYAAIRHGGTYEGEVPFMRADGEPFWGKVQGTNLFPDRPDEYQVFSITDITDQIAQQTALAQARDQAEAASRAKSAFLTGMSHEIRTPLNAILGFTQVLARNDTLGAAEREALDTIERGGRHLLTLINDVLDMAKIEAGRMRLQEAPFDLPTLLGELAEVFEQRARERGLRLTVVPPPGPRRVLGDATKLRQVLFNLLGNALKFTPAGAVTLSVATDGAGHQTRFSVIDTGIGIAPQDQARIFEPFTQTETGERVQGGTGLGLALSRQYVQLMGGTLTLESTPGQGSRFTFALSLPAAPPSAVEPVKRPEVHGLAPDQPPCRVLIVDDLADNRAPLRALLEGLNPPRPVLEVREAADGGEALALWETWQPRLIFMDMRMPRMAGDEATRRIRAREAERAGTAPAIIVALSASVFESDRARVLACGCDAFIRKPFEAADLYDVLERQLGLRFVQTTPTPDAALSPHAVAARLDAGPPSWRAELIAAVQIGDFVHIGSVIETIRPHDCELADTLAPWAHAYDLERLTTALRREPAGSDSILRRPLMP